jgi:hypothetical protein
MSVGRIPSSKKCAIAPALRFVLRSLGVGLRLVPVVTC